MTKEDARNTLLPMIRDLPSEADFLWEGMELLNLAWDSVMGLLRNLDDLGRDKSTLDEISGEYWTAAARRLSMALGLAQQGAEFILKGRIAGINPVLLIATPVREWPNRDTAFGDFKTVDALELPRLHDSVIEPPLEPGFVEIYGKLRHKRNAVLHTVDKRLSISAHDVIEAVLETSHHLIDPRTWLTVRSARLELSPEAVAFSPDFVEGLVIREALLSLTVLTRAEAIKYYGFDKRRRAYVCPKCSRAYHHLTDRYPQSAQLTSRTPDADAVVCFICAEATGVVRRECEQADCRGNVIYDEEDTCLTCDRQQASGAT